MNGFVTILLKQKTHRNIKKMLNVYQVCNRSIFPLRAFKCKKSAKNDPHRLKDSTYSPIIRRIKQAFSAYSVVNNYLFE